MTIQKKPEAIHRRLVRDQLGRYHTVTEQGITADELVVLARGIVRQRLLRQVAMGQSESVRDFFELALSDRASQAGSLILLDEQDKVLATQALQREEGDFAPASLIQAAYAERATRALLGVVDTSEDGVPLKVMATRMKKLRTAIKPAGVLLKDVWVRTPREGLVSLHEQRLI